MTKNELLSYTPKEAFAHGKQMKLNGKSEDYNPYRNVDNKYSSLFNAWVLGWNS